MQTATRGNSAAGMIIVVMAIMAIVLISGTMAGCRSSNDAKKTESFEMRLQQLEDREEIRMLLKNYGRFLDKRDFAAFASLFAGTEGEWIGGMGKARGSAAIQQLMEDTIGTGDGVMPNYHLFANETINVSGDTAEAVSKWLFLIQGEDGRPRLVYLGRYEDSLIRENGAWKFLQRIVSGEIPADQ